MGSHHPIGHQSITKSELYEERSFVCLGVLENFPSDKKENGKGNLGFTQISLHLWNLRLCSHLSKLFSVNILAVTTVVPFQNNVTNHLLLIMTCIHIGIYHPPQRIWTNRTWNWFIFFFLFPSENVTTFPVNIIT